MQLPPPALTVAPEESESLKTVAAKLGSRLRKDTELFALYPFRRDKRRRMEELHDLLLLSALSFAERKGRAGLPTVCLNYYGELLAAICGLSRTTIYSYLDILASAGLLAYKGRVVSVEVEGKQVNRCDGSIMRLTLDAAIKPKLTQHDFRTVRNLSKDIKEGRTVYRFLQDSKELEQSLDQLDTKTKINLLINPSLPPVGKEKSFRLVTVQVMPGDLSNAIKALPDAKKGDRATDVDEVAHWLSLSLGDTHSLDKWRKTLWQLLRAEDVGLNPRLVGGKCLFAEVADLLEQVLAAKREGITRNAGALRPSQAQKMELVGGSSACTPTARWTVTREKDQCLAGQTLEEQLPKGWGASLLLEPSTLQLANHVVIELLCLFYLCGKISHFQPLCPQVACSDL